MIHLELNDSRLDSFRSLKGRGGLENNQIVIESEKVIEKFLMCSSFATTILSTKEWIEETNLDISKFDNHFLLNKADMSKLVGYHYHQGVIAMASLPTSSKLEDFKGDTLILNGVSSPENVGALVRSAAGLGFKNILFDHESCHPFIRRCIRVSMGNIFFMKWHHTYNLKDSITKLQSLGHKVFGGANEAGSLLLTENIWPKSDCGLVIGSEGHGMSSTIIDACDQILKIPMIQEVAHLNAAGAGAILMYDRFRAQLS
ncbi:MAG: hypothetical protein COW01_05995 [Bdellovibrionales bacterium CG12_big_fil_rev_8_21_14_0_65_38_15]|nr:MAG: hypothetical protein COW79_03890 [Bdellovibrionales bacterium CG22_combo_CG10-13_8_21_14_all_38_13]PIQ55983.1 MAG: hypothetical protein COW01_05995 [Bdellovibrionales bacterium CG12_big_fil_rev_8_21_14_0_65_38_15]PIR30588.1 MAG: hypothetical protein COV38_04535 [Bdellovibrionales bacterium CG11_big_fil_rev_8_21_14_0_20_38_13]